MWPGATSICSTSVFSPQMANLCGPGGTVAAKCASPDERPTKCPVSSRMSACAPPSPHSPPPPRILYDAEMRRKRLVLGSLVVVVALLGGGLTVAPALLFGDGVDYS